MVGEDDARLRGDLVAQCFHAALQEEHHRRVVVLPFARGPAIEEVADGIDADDVRRSMRESGADCRGHEGHALIVEQHAQLRGDNEGVTGAGHDRGIEPELLQPLAQVVVLDLGLEIEHTQRARRREAQERRAGGGVHQQADQEV